MSVSKAAPASRPASATPSAKKTSTTTPKAPAAKSTGTPTAKGTGSTATKTPSTSAKHTDSASVSREATETKPADKAHESHLKALEKSFGTDSEKAKTDDKSVKTDSEKAKTDDKSVKTDSEKAKTDDKSVKTDSEKAKTDDKSAGEIAAQSTLGARATADVADAVGTKFTDGGGKFPRGAKIASGALGGIASAAALPGQVSEAAGSVKKAFETGKGDDIRDAVGDSASVASSALTVAKSPLEVAKGVHDFKTKGAAADALSKALPDASPEVRKAAISAAAEESLKDVGPKDARRAVTKAAGKAAKDTSTLAKGAGATSRGAAKAALREGGEAAAKAATQAVAKGALKTTAKAAGRFVPGVNVAIAAADTAAAYATITDPNASPGKKITSGITAVGSVVAATNIPVVSQVGAAVSTVSSFLGSFF